MNKRLKITLYIILILAIVVVIWLMFGNTNPSIETPSSEDIKVPVEEISDSGTNTFTYEDNDTFEEDVMKDLEGFFGNNNGYEDVQGEYGFNTPEDE